MTETPAEPTTLPQPPTNQPAPARKNSPIIFLLVLLGIAILAAGYYSWYAYYGPCGIVPVKNTVKELQDITTEWQDTEKIASSTPRISLSGPISQLQSLRRKTANLTTPDCAQNAKTQLIAGMDYTIDSYLVFASQGSQEIINQKFSLSGMAFDRYAEELNHLTYCAPSCQ